MSRNRLKSKVTWSICLHSSALLSHPRLLFHFPRLAHCGTFPLLGKVGVSMAVVPTPAAAESRTGTARMLQGLWGAAGCQLHAAEWRRIQNISITLELASAETESNGCGVHLIHLSAGRDCSFQGLIEIPARALVQVNPKMYFHPCNFPAHCWGYLGVYV